jgi:prepilin-type processing-associated H-X9-DG protein
MPTRTLTVEGRLAHHLATVRYEDLPPEAVAATKYLLVDTIADMAASLRSPECLALRDRWAEMHGAGACSVVGKNHGLSAGSAAFLNGVFAHWFEWDDVHIPSILHASAVLFPTLLAAAEAGGLADDEDGGKEFIAACVGAFDVAARASEALVPHMHNGWMPTGSAVIGAAGGAARLLGLGIEGIHSAMGIAASTMGVGRQPIKDMVNGKNVLCGLVAESAMRSAILAEQGILGAKGFLFGPFGANTLFADGHGSEETALAGLGERFSVSESSIKLYPCCQSTHGCIGATLEIRADTPDILEQVEKIDLRLPQRNFDLVGAPFRIGENPRVSAQFNVSFTVALALRNGAVRIDDFNDDAVRDADEVIALAARTDVGVNDEPGHQVRLRLKDGTFREATTTILKGDPRRPLNDTDRRTKLDDALSIFDPSYQSNSLLAVADGVAARGIGKLTAWVRGVG